MKRLILLVVICLIAGAGYSQKKPKINAAEKARSEGNLGEAKEIIDEAIVHEKTKDDGKTWYYRGLIYASLDTTSNPQYQNLANDPLKIAMEAFAKADQIDPDGSKYYISNEQGFPVPKEQQISGLWGHYLNEGVQYYQDQNTEQAVKYFTKTQVVNPDDTTGYMYAGLAAQSGKDFATAATNFYKLVNDFNTQDEDVYNALIYIEGSVNKDDDKALAIIRKAKNAFPNNTEFAKSEINALIRMEKVDEAKAELEKAITAEPDNPTLYFTLGVMNEELGNLDKAKEAYEKAIEVDPTYFNAVYNTAVLYYNEAGSLIKEKNALGISNADQKKAKEMQKEIDVKIKAALPRWEKVNEMEPNDRTTLETLQYLYSYLDMKEKVVAIGKQLESLPEEGEQ